MGERGRIRERGTVPCRECKRPHHLYTRFDSANPQYVSWADPDDGHAYYPMSAEEVVRFRRLG